MTVFEDMIVCREDGVHPQQPHRLRISQKEERDQSGRNNDLGA